MHGAAVPVARGPAEIVEALEQRRAQAARQMMAAHAPVEAGFAQRPALVRQRVEIDAEVRAGIPRRVS